MRARHGSVRPRTLPIIMLALVMVLGYLPVANAAGGGISGTVTVGGTPSTGVSVYAYHATLNYRVGSDSVDASGRYDIQGLPAGTYKIYFSPQVYNAGNLTGYLGEYYDNIRDVATATLVTVTDGVTTTLADAELDNGGSISGTVTGEDGPLAGSFVIAYDTVVQGVVASAYTDASGHYVLIGLNAHPHRISFRDPETGEKEYYADSPDQEHATPVVPVIGLETPGIDAYLDFDGNIGGTVTGDGGPLHGITITAVDRESGSMVKETATDSSGNYTLTDLEAGDYEIHFDAGNYNYAHGTTFLTEYYNNVYAEELANPFTITGGHTYDIDADLEVGGRIAGTVTSADGVRPDVPVAVLDAATGEMVTSTWTGVTGEYRTAPIPAGDYIVKFVQQWFSDDYLTEYYPDAHQMTDASPVTVNSGAVTLDVDAELEPDTRLDGYVSCSTGSLSGIDVCLYDADTGELVDSTITGSDGSYCFRGLPERDYVVWFDPTDYNAANGTQLLPEYHLNVVDAGDDTYWEAVEVIPIRIRAYKSVSAKLGVAATRITGTVMSDAGAPLAGVDVYAWDAYLNPWEEYDYAGHAVTDSSGHFEIYGLSAGPYFIEYDPTAYNEGPNSNYVGEYYRDADYIDDSSYIWTLEGQETPDINARLERDATPSPGATPVYRFYRPSTGTHFYTADVTEMVRVRDTMRSTYTYEGVGYYINTNSPANSVPLYRFYNRKTGTHLYTADEGEKNTILATLSNVYSLDGVAYNVSMSAGVQVYRFYSPSKGVHFYSSDPNEIAYVRANLGHVWSFEGPAYLVAQ